MGAVAIARRIKQNYPNIVTALGGPNAFAPMGEDLAICAGCFDWVFTGEADESFAERCRGFISGENVADHLQVVSDRPIADLNLIPLPNFSSYKKQVRAIEKMTDRRFPVSLPIEFSRGCWWGQKYHCTFCGLNGNGMVSRAKRTERCLQEL